MYILKIVAYILVIVGALNWGLVGIFDFDLVETIFGEMSVLSRIVYGAVGLSGLFLLLAHRDIFYHNNHV